MKDFFKRAKKFFKKRKRYATIGSVYLSNKESIEALRAQTNDVRYDLVPAYDMLRFEIHPYEWPESTLKRKRKAIKKQVGKHKFRILQGFWTFGIDFFDSEDYQDLLIKRAEKKARKKAEKAATAQEI